MKKIFIAYADKKMYYSLQRIGIQARSLNFFDEIILWTSDDLPDYIKKSPLMQYAYGGGYWAWKPCIIYETLQRYTDDSIVCYVDAGCTLNPGVEWILYYELMKTNDFLCFQYRDEMPEWAKFGNQSTKIKYWTKKEAILFYDNWVGDTDWQEHNKIWGGCIWAKGKSNVYVKQWLNLVLDHPEIIMDPLSTDEQYPFFARHKHDQSLLVALTSKYREKCCILPELSETCGEKVAIYASRIRAKNRKEYLVNRSKYHLRKILGSTIVDLIKNKLK